VKNLNNLDKVDWENARFLGMKKLLSESWASKATMKKPLHIYNES
jgi:hypothetical protein